MPQNASIISTIIPFVLMIAIFYIIILVPEKKRKKKYAAMVEGLRVNDKIMTKGGIIGKITRIHDDFVVLESGPDKSKIKLSKNGIASVFDETLNEEK
ncbi:preprotein translocase subunit YajC [Clostridium aestuarii]|uniref:Preprotein translocase subunit YajC n=1 Tax=Clostridium aestuarii TaxID=338193 RepID=A0ABT4CX94_9CLOT|nr:preprotein translocase subunit YajC [Clostridium aestuarii]MCY6483617.1 preprotein translocase subunit YajC [Clostridium aestuarii]